MKSLEPLQKAPRGLFAARRIGIGTLALLWLMVTMAPLAFVAIAWWYARRADRLDVDHAADAGR